MSRFITAPLPDDEEARMADVDATGLFGTEPEPVYDDITALAASICGVPMSSITVIAGDRQWLKSRLGIDESETSRDDSFCAHTITEPEHPMVVPDTVVDFVFAGHPAVTGDIAVRFYAGFPLHGPRGHAIGTLCVIDNEPRHLTEEQMQDLERLARVTEALILSRVKLTGSRADAGAQVESRT